MVEWYDPKQLARTGASIFTSTIFGRNADQRLLEAHQAEAVEYFDYSVDDANVERRELWIDYVADAGDGFDSTYAVASAVASKTLDVQDPSGTPYTTHRGRILVFGGDLVYPLASRDAYEQRLVMPYEHALPRTRAPHPDVYAIPGNHDWYDNLVAFTRRFCSKRWFAGWRTQQRVSYFALQLPHNWWLLGTDVQLESDIDADQLEYFRAIAAKMNDRTRIILCNAEPHWIYEKKYRHLDRESADRNLRFLEDKVFHRRIAVFVAGDMHHYRRHDDDCDHHKIVAGGGGAFLHPTHDADVETLPGLTTGQPYQLRCSYPEVATSRALTKRNLLFVLWNPRFGLITALLYLMTCHATQVDLSMLGLRDICEALGKVLYATSSNPTTLLWVSAIVISMVLFTETHSTSYRILGGLSHALAHLIAVFLVGWGASWLVGRWQLPLALDLLSISALVFAGGWIVGSLVMGAYLFVSLNGFGRHSNEAFSSLAIKDWKNFLRLHIDERGTLRIYPIGIDRVPRRRRQAASRPYQVSRDPKATPPRLIEPPIVIRNPDSGSTAAR
jgi:Calcineurin-like phosphoesterase